MAGWPFYFDCFVLFGFGGFDSLIQSAIGAVAHLNDDRLAIDFHFALLQIDVPTATGSPQGVAARISADRTLSGDGAISGHVCYLPRNGFENISRFALHFNDEYRPLV